MKKLLLFLMATCVIASVVNAQQEGYNWYFTGVSPYASAPAIQGSPGNHTLTTVGTGSITIATGETVGLGACGATTMDVAQFTKPVGLNFDNSPQFVGQNWTVEMTVNFDDVSGIIRLLGFSGDDNGIYINAPGTGINFYTGTDDFVLTTINAGQWYDLVFVRDSATKRISFYQDGAFIGFHDDLTDAFIPQVSNTNMITLLKDEVDNTEEASGKLAKVGIYNKALSAFQVSTLFNHICDPAFTFIPPNFAIQGYQWDFSAGPAASTPADAASTGSYTLSAVGSGSFVTANTSLAGLGTSCTGNEDVTSYTKPWGFEMNNSPQYVGDNYSIEMAVNIADVTSSFVRLLGFSGNDDGIYIFQGGGSIYLATDGGATQATLATTINSNTWYHFIFTRDSATKNITVYQDGVSLGVFNDVDNLLKPLEENFYTITFLKDDVDNAEESNGMIAKAAIFNKVLTQDQVTERFNNICNANLIVLPVSLTNFTAKKTGTQVQLAWTTSSEVNSRGFEVQRSSDGTSYEALGFVNANGNTTIESNYHFTDPAPKAGKNYYRLKIEDMDNRSVFSVIRTLDMSKELQDLQLYPNPAKSAITIVNIKAGNLLTVFDMNGKSVLVKRAANTQENLQVNHLAAGIYVMQVTDNDGSKRSIRFTKF